MGDPTDEFVGLVGKSAGAEAEAAADMSEIGANGAVGGSAADGVTGATAISEEQIVAPDRQRRGGRQRGPRLLPEPASEVRFC